MVNQKQADKHVPGVVCDPSTVTLKVLDGTDKTRMLVECTAVGCKRQFHVSEKSLANQKVQARKAHKVEAVAVRELSQKEREEIEEEEDRRVRRAEQSKNIREVPIAKWEGEMLRSNGYMFQSTVKVKSFGIGAWPSWQSLSRFTQPHQMFGVVFEEGGVCSPRISMLGNFLYNKLKDENRMEDIEVAKRLSIEHLLHSTAEDEDRRIADGFAKKAREAAAEAKKDAESRAPCTSSNVGYLDAALSSISTANTDDVLMFSRPSKPRIIDLRQRERVNTLVNTLFQKDPVSLEEMLTKMLAK